MLGAIHAFDVFNSEFKRRVCGRLGLASSGGILLSWNDSILSWNDAPERTQAEVVEKEMGL
jgi:hypothetical protein